MSALSMHTAVGMAAPFLLGFISFLRTRRLTSNMLLVVTVLMILCGAAAELPDILPYVIARGTKEYSALKAEYHSGPGAKLAFLHQYLDQHRTEDGGAFTGAFMLLSMFFLLFLAAAYSLLANEKEIRDLEAIHRSAASGSSPPTI